MPREKKEQLKGNLIELRQRWGSLLSDAARWVPQLTNINYIWKQTLSESLFPGYTVFTFTYFQASRLLPVTTFFNLCCNINTQCRIVGGNQPHSTRVAEPTWWGLVHLGVELGDGHPAQSNGKLA